MQLDDLKQAWQEHDRKLDASIRLNRQLLHESVFGKTRTVLKRLTLRLGLELLVDAVLLMWLGNFLWEHATQARFAAPALLLVLCLVASVNASIRQLIAISALDYDAPVLANQKRLESVRVVRVRTTKWTLLLSPLLWVPLLIVPLKGFLDVDLYTLVPGAWVSANILLGLLVIAVGVWASRRYAGRMTSASWLQRLVHDAAGRNLNAATAYLSSLSEFEDGEGEAAESTPA